MLGTILLQVRTWSGNKTCSQKKKKCMRTYIKQTTYAYNNLCSPYSWHKNGTKGLECKFFKGKNGVLFALTVRLKHNDTCWTELDQCRNILNVYFLFSPTFILDIRYMYRFVTWEYCVMLRFGVQIPFVLVVRTVPHW